jgi:phosphatidylglycerol---prolipoprotein diacylglyceryl transferase
MIHFTFISPSFLGLMLFITFISAVLLPRVWFSRWLAFGCGLLGATIAGFIGWVPWLGPLMVTGYSVMMVAGFIAAYIVTVRRVRIIGMTEQQLLTIFMLGLTGGIIGSRLGEVWEQWPQFIMDKQGQTLSLAAIIAKFFDFDGGGMVWYTGAILGGIFILLYARTQRLALLSVSDTLMPAVVLGLGVGRVGCFLNGCCYGRPSTAPWAVKNPFGVASHPTQLYETSACVLLFALTWWWWGRRRTQGEVLFIGMVGYALWRIVNESLRADTVALNLFSQVPMTTSQGISALLIMLMLGIAGVVSWRRRDPQLAELARHVPGSRHHRPTQEKPVTAS